MTLRAGVFVVVIAAAAFLASAAASEADEDAFKALLTAGDKLVRDGRSSYGAAVLKYGEALSLRPESARALYSRAEVLSMLRDAPACLRDLDRLLAVDAAHRQGRALRAKLRAAAGDLVEAAEDQEALARLLRTPAAGSGGGTSASKLKAAGEAAALAERLRAVGREWQAVQRELAALPADVALARRCVAALGDVIAHFATDSVPLRMRRARCALVARDHGAMSDALKWVVKREPSNLAAAALGAQALRALGATEQAKGEVRRCLALDPEFAPCQRLHKRIRAHAKATTAAEELAADRKWEALLAHIDEMFAAEAETTTSKGGVDAAEGLEPPNADQLWRWRIDAHTALGNIEQGLAACDALLEGFGATVDTFLAKAELFAKDDRLDAADEAVRKAADVQQNNDKVREWQQRLQRLRESAARKDYYKILGVKKSAGDAEIKKAYRKQTRLHHPDIVRSEELTEKERAARDQLYRDINEAKDVLMDPERRRRYDAGEDVTKPAGQQGGGGPFHGSPFHFNFGGGGGNPFGQQFGGGNFHFTFG